MSTLNLGDILRCDKTYAIAANIPQLNWSIEIRTDLISVFQYVPELECHHATWMENTWSVDMRGIQRLGNTFAYEPVVGDIVYNLEHGELCKITSIIPAPYDLELPREDGNISIVPCTQYIYKMQSTYFEKYYSVNSRDTLLLLKIPEPLLHPKEIIRPRFNMLKILLSHRKNDEKINSKQ